MKPPLLLQVYHMPGSSDNFVTAFRTWLSKYGGGGPFGPMDHHWLQVSLLLMSHTVPAPISTMSFMQSACKSYNLLQQDIVTLSFVGRLRPHNNQNVEPVTVRQGQFASVV